VGTVVKRILDEAEPKLRTVGVANISRAKGGDGVVGDAVFLVNSDDHGRHGVTGRTRETDLVAFDKLSGRGRQRRNAWWVKSNAEVGPLGVSDIRRALN